MFHPTVPHTYDFLSHFVPLWQGKNRHRCVFFSVLHISLAGLSRRVESAAKATSAVMGFLPTRSRYSCGERARGVARSREVGAKWGPETSGAGSTALRPRGAGSAETVLRWTHEFSGRNTRARSPVVCVGIANKVAKNQRAPRFAMRRPWIAKASSTIDLSGVPGPRLLRPSRGPCSIRDSSATRDSITACAPSRTPLRE